jgi:hypothetical protein
MRGVSKRALQLYSEDVYSVLNCHNVANRPLSFASDSYGYKTRGLRSAEQGGHAIGAALPIRRPGKRVLTYLRTSPT